MKKFEVLHTSSLLRKHQLLVFQEGSGDKVKFSYVHWEAPHKPASKRRIAAFEAEEDALGYALQG